jgi:hypothetical protein
LRKDCVTLLLCSNASGSYLLKLLLIAHSENSRALKNKDKRKLPVHWKSNRKAWMTGDIFGQWFKNNFVKEVKSFLEKKNLSFKILLILDNAPSHPSMLKELKFFFHHRTLLHLFNH